MATPGTVFVQSISSLGGKAVAGTVLANSTVLQWVSIVGTDAPADVKSYASGNPLLVALTDKSGAHTTVLSVAGTVVASVPGQVFVTASIAGSLPVTFTGGTITGSVGATQLGAPWVTQAASTGALQSIAGSVGASQLGAPWQVVGSVNVTGTVGATVAGSVFASQAGGWVVTGSVGASQLGTWTFTGSTQVTQASSPWATRPGSTGTVFSTAASVQGQVTATVSVAGSVPVTFTGATVTGSVQASQAGSWSMFLQGSDGTRLAVDSFAGGGLLRVAVYSSVGGGAGTSQVSVWIGNTPTIAQGTVPWIVAGSVGVTQQTSPWITQAGSSGAMVLVTASVTGQVTVTASCIGQQFVTASCVGQQFVTASIAGSVPVTFTGATVTGSIGATQLGAPWSIVGSVSVTGSVGAIIVGSITGTVVASLPGQTTVTASLIGVPAFVGSVYVTQQSSPWIQDPIRYTMRVDYSSGGNPRYIGRAVPGASETASVWQIEQCSFNGSNQFLAKTWPASGGTAFTFPWSGRAGITYL